ncbi:hypothetical protein PUN28_015269 [Cardiocondyla obscurior]|uniref:Uncharacterized protein n=1 Tax=Cardiocondyla obscurior TaxID=286306 RepID=A0AAW2EY47_9HYME
MAGGEGMEAVEALKRYWTFHPIPQYILARSTNNEKLTGEVHNNQTDPQPGSSGINTFFSTEEIFRGRKCTTSCKRKRKDSTTEEEEFLSPDSSFK